MIATHIKPKGITNREMIKKLFSSIVFRSFETRFTNLPTLVSLTVNAESEDTLLESNFIKVTRNYENRQ